jgi:4-amino-4-deoxy-L-arabinose transferase-like glycosyltransferase
MSVSEEGARGHEPTRSDEPLRLLAVVMVAIVSRLPGLGASFYGDEAFSLLRDSNAWFPTSQDRFRPLYFSLLFGWKQLGFHGEVGLRSLSLLFGLMQVPVAYALGRRLGGRHRGALFALLVTVDPILIEFSQELRMYSLVPLIGLLQAWAFVEIVARSSERRPVLAAWVGFVVAGVAGVYTHLHYWFLLVGFGFALWRRRRELSLREGALALAAIVLLYLPNVPNVLAFQRADGGQAHLTATDLPSALPKLAAAFLVGFNYFHVPDMGLSRAIPVSSLGPNLALGVLVAVPAAVLGWQIVRLCASRKPGPLVWLSIELFGVPVLVSFVATALTARNFVHPKYMIFSAPFSVLLIAAGYAAIPRRAVRASVALLGASVFATAYVHWSEPERYGRREDWRGVAAFLRPLLGEHSQLLLLSSVYAPPPGAASTSLWDYYATDLSAKTRFIVVPRPDASVAEVAESAEPLVEGKSDVYYLWSQIARDFDDPRDLVLSAARSTWTDEERRQFAPRLVLYHWRTK